MIHCYCAATKSSCIRQLGVLPRAARAAHAALPVHQSCNTEMQMMWLQRSRTVLAPVCQQLEVETHAQSLAAMRIVRASAVRECARQGYSSSGADQWALVRWTLAARRTSRASAVKDSARIEGTGHEDQWAVVRWTFAAFRPFKAASATTQVVIQHMLAYCDSWHIWFMQLCV